MDSLQPKFPRASCVIHRRPHAPGDDAHTATAQLLNLFDHVGFDRRGELIGEIGDGQHPQEASARRRCAASIPAMVNNNPFTN